MWRRLIQSMIDWPFDIWFDDEDKNVTQDQDNFFWFICLKPERFVRFATSTATFGLSTPVYPVLVPRTWGRFPSESSWVPEFPTYRLSYSWLHAVWGMHGQTSRRWETTWPTGKRWCNQTYKRCHIRRWKQPEWSGWGGHFGKSSPLVCSSKDRSREPSMRSKKRGQTAVFPEHTSCRLALNESLVNKTWLVVNIPNDQENQDDSDEIIGLIVNQVSVDTIIPLLQIGIVWQLLELKIWSN